MRRGRTGRPPAGRGGSRLVAAAVAAVVSAPALLSIFASACAPAAGSARSAPPPVAARGSAVAAASIAPAPEAPLWGAPRPLTPETREKLTAAIAGVRAGAERELARKGIPGLAFGVVAGGEVLAAEGLGARDRDQPFPVDGDTVFRVGSITKTLTAMALLKLRDEGKLALDEPITRLLPELGSLVHLDPGAPPITLVQLATHTSGLPRLGPYDYTRTDRDLTEEEMLDALAGFELVRRPGATRAYSNLGYQLLGLTIGRAAGMRYQDYVSRELLAPLGMRSSVWRREDVPAARLATGYRKVLLFYARPGHWRQGAAQAAGGLYSSARDMTRYMLFQLDAWAAGSGSEPGPLARSSVRASHELLARAAPRGGSAEERPRGTGIGWGVIRHPELGRIVWHNGGSDGYGSALYLLPEEGLGVVLLANLAGADLDALALGSLTILRRARAGR